MTDDNGGYGVAVNLGIVFIYKFVSIQPAVIICIVSALEEFIKI